MSSQRSLLLTGATGGIGRAIAHRFAAEGFRVALHFRRDEVAAEALRSSIPGEGHFAIQADLTDPQAAMQLMARVVEEFDGIDVLINNAAIAEAHPPLQTDYQGWRDAWDRTLATNLIAPANLSHQAAQVMVKQGRGHIINISSRGAFRGEPDMPAYGASKAGLNALSQSLAKALAPHGVFVMAIAPGWVATDRVAPKFTGASGEAILRDAPLGRVATPEEVANTAFFLASESGGSLTGAIIDVNGASHLR